MNRIHFHYPSRFRLSRLAFLVTFLAWILGCHAGAGPSSGPIEVEQKDTTRCLPDSLAFDSASLSYLYWVTQSGSCLSLRDSILKVSSLIPVTWKDDDSCRVDSGIWWDSYSSTLQDTIRAADSVILDLVVSLEEAWVSGGWQWDSTQWMNFYNDPLELWLTSSANASEKAGRDILHWAPASMGYVAAWKYVKKTYHLTAVHSENLILASIGSTDTLPLAPLDCLE